MNIKLNYLYRDGSNYKQFNAVVFRNTSLVSINEIETSIKTSLISQQWFVAKDWELPDMHFKQYQWDSEIDHDWHEFDSIEETTEKPTEIKDIKEFLILLKNNKSSII